MVYHPLCESTYQESLNELEADIQHANALAATIPKAKGGAYLQMKLVQNELAPLVFFLLQWLDGLFSCLFPLYFNLFDIIIYEVYVDGRPNMSTHRSKTSVREFYAIILPSLRRLHSDLVEQESCNHVTKRRDERKKIYGQGGLQTITMEQERENECGVCLEPCTKMVLPGCCHALCINCYRDWNTISKSCPFCRRGLRRVKSEDLWVLTSESEVIDTDTITKEELSRFYLYIQSLHKDIPESISWVYHEYLI